MTPAAISCGPKAAWRKLQCLRVKNRNWRRNNHSCRCSRSDRCRNGPTYCAEFLPASTRSTQTCRVHDSSYASHVAGFRLRNLSNREIRSLGRWDWVNSNSPRLNWNALESLKGKALSPDVSIKGARPCIGSPVRPALAEMRAASAALLHPLLKLCNHRGVARGRMPRPQE